MILLFMNFFGVGLVLSMLLGLMAFFASKKGILEFEKSSPFECGFNPSTFFRVPFSMQFFLVALLFLIFDVEMVLLYPFLFKQVFLVDLYHMVICLLFVLILFVGLYHEWNQKSLQWS